MENILPRNNTYLLGHEEAEKLLFNAWKNNKLHNSWIISGTSGIGKATFAYKFIRFLLNGEKLENSNTYNLDVNPNSSVVKLISNDAHPDLLVLEKGYTDADRRKIERAIRAGDPLNEEDKSSLKKSSIIRVDEVRQINEFLSKKSANNGWRVVLVDAVDDLNTAGANAILKVLEEPPHKTIIILISNNPNNLLPTISSRCAKLNLKPLENNIVSSLLRRYRPEISEEKISSIVSISSGSIKKAIDYSDYDAVSVYNDICNIVYAKENFSTTDLISFSNNISKNEDMYFLAKELILKFISENIKKTENIKELYEVWEYASKVFLETEQLNLDKKQILINILVKLTKII